MGKRQSGTKYHAIKTIVDGIMFHSKKEAKRYQELRLLEKAGKISNLETQVRYTLIPKDELGRAVEYVCDFGYYEQQPDKIPLWQWVIEDVKGFRTDVYKLKRRMLFKEMGLVIRET